MARLAHLSRGGQVDRRPQARFLDCQAIFVNVGTFCSLRNEHDIMRGAERRVSGRRSAHIDDVSAAGVIGAGLDHADVFQCARLSGSDETHTV